MVRGKMLGGFAPAAYPANWDNCGTITLLVNHDGIACQKDLGPNTAAAAGTMKRFNPDSTWQRL
jgi:hypothetical protein